MEGKGEKITFIEFNDQLDIGVVLINPRIQLSTKKVFNNFTLKEPKSLSIRDNTRGWHYLNQGCNRVLNTIIILFY